MLALGMIEYVMENHMKGKGMKGIAGTSSSYRELLGSETYAKAMENFVMCDFGLEAFPVATQVYPRIVDYTQLSALATLAVAAHKFAMDLRLFSAPFLGEMYKKPEEGKVGSSAAPWKVFNPTEAERINSLARYIAALPQIAWMNASCNLFERTLDDSANRRIILAEGYLAADQMMMEYDNILRNLGLREGTIKKNLRNYGTFMKAEPLLMEAVKRGANRQEFHESIRRHIMPAYEYMLETGQNPLHEMLKNDPEITRIFNAQEIDTFLIEDRELDAELGTAEMDALTYLKEFIDPKLNGDYADMLGNHPKPEF